MNKKIVIKLGSLAVTNEKGGVDREKIDKVVEEIIQLQKQNYSPILVSSGAINTGKSYIQKPEEKKMMISYQQACAAVGQPLLMKEYIEAFLKHKITCAQVLVTHEDFKNHKRVLNIRNTLSRLVSNGIIPIINENDTVSFEEITVGDNDQLAALITQSSDAEALLLLTEADGLYNKNPKEIDAIQFKEIDYKDDFSHITFSEKTSVGRGGMDTKLKAVRKLTPLGIDVYIGSFFKPHSLTRLLSRDGGTLFKGNPKRIKSSRESWVSTLVKNEAWIVVDEGCAHVLVQGKNSLLPVGIKKVHGPFRRGDVIQIKFRNKLIGVGISEFSDKELDLIKGKKSSEINSIILGAPSNVAIHKDNLSLREASLGEKK